MPGKVFVSCGQRAPKETKVAEAVSRLLREKYHLKPYLAFRVQSLGDIMAITNELRTSDYYLLLDFRRRKKEPEDLPCSLFTHQELALAHHLGFREQIIALQQEGAPLEGFLRYVQSNPTSFKTTSDLLKKLQVLIEEKGWNANYSRNLVLGGLTKLDPFNYGDHTGWSRNIVWTIKVENRRPDMAAAGVVCILDTINGAPCDDRAYLKWVDQSSYEVTILPNDFGQVALFAVRPDMPGLFLQSLRDHKPRQPIVRDSGGDYDLAFKVFARDFPLLQFKATVHLRWQPSSENSWANWETQTEAELKACG